MKPRTTHRYTVTLDERRMFRQFKVTCATSDPKGVGPLSRRVITSITYSTVGYYWTWRGAQKVAHRLNAAEGNAQ